MHVWTECARMGRGGSCSHDLMATVTGFTHAWADCCGWGQWAIPPLVLQVDLSGASLTISLFSLTVQVDQSGASVTVALFSLGGITWSSVSIVVSAASASYPPPAPSAASMLPPSRRRLLQAPLRASGSPLMRGLSVTGPPTHQEEPSTGSSQPAARRPLGLRSLQQASGVTCAPTITRCVTRVLPPPGESVLPSANAC